jgi:PEP-CTERM motif
MASKVGKSVNVSRTYSLVGPLLAPVVALGLSTAPVGAQNLAPPSQGVVMDLSDPSTANNLKVNEPNSSYSEDFTISAGDIASGSSTLTFLFRDDFAYINFSKVALYDVSSDPEEKSNLLTNGDFSLGVAFSNGNLDTPTGWTFFNPPVNTMDQVFVAGGFASGALCAGGGDCWSDGTTGGYDGLSQTVKVNGSDTYEISFDATVTGVPPKSSDSSNSVWSQINTTSGIGFNGNAVDMLAYFGPIQNFAQAPPPPPPCLSCDIPVPEPSTWAMMLLGFAGLAFIGYRRASALAS